MLLMKNGAVSPVFFARYQAAHDEHADGPVAGDRLPGTRYTRLF